MSVSDILNEINLLPPREKIWLLQQALKSLRDIASKEEMTIAAEALAEEYRTNKELTSFTGLDFETFYEARGDLDDKFKGEYSIEN